MDCDLDWCGEEADHHIVVVEGDIAIRIDHCSLHDEWARAECEYRLEKEKMQK